MHNNFLGENRTKPKPEHPTGWRKGRLEVTKYHGYTDINLAHPKNGSMARPQHWYTVQCDCGRSEIIGHSSLCPTGRDQCRHCAQEARTHAARHRAKKPTEAVTQVPDFATMRF